MTPLEEDTPMQDKLKQRFETLKSEYEAGQKMLAELEARRQELTSTLLRIEGAMQVLREVLAPEEATPTAGAENRLPKAG
jgi:predicted nuclease with TOPRIM domain